MAKKHEAKKEDSLPEDLLKLLDLARKIKRRRLSQKQLREQQAREKVLRRTDALMGKPDPSNPKALEKELLEILRDLFTGQSIKVPPAYQIPNPKLKK